MQTHKIFFLLILILLQTAFVLAQINSYDPGGQVRAILEPLIMSQFGLQYSFEYQVFDSVINKLGDDNREEILDPYGTLKGCVIFAIFKERDEYGEPDSSRLGILKNGTIVWVSQPIIKGMYIGLFASRDINNDGQVELLTKWSANENLNASVFIETLWIIRWNGNSGNIINAVNNNGNSTIISVENFFELFDAERDGLFEIRADWLSGDDNWAELFPEDNIPTRPDVTYIWNGSLYQIAPPAKQIPGSAFLPANRLQVEVNSKVKRNSDTLQYYYMWKNLVNSEQRMATFALVGISEYFKDNVLTGWQYMGMRRGLNAYGWEPKIYEMEKTFSKNIYVRGLLLSSDRLPSIIQFIIQGFRPFPDYDLANPNNLELSKNDFLNNSFKGLTIGPSDPPNPFIPLNFLDTLTSYTTQSRLLEWIKDQATADKYLGYFNSAKTSLAQNNTASARATLNQVLQDSNIDSTSNITSEAYALIRYNTEYLLSQLPTAPPPAGCNVKLVNSAGAKLTGGTLQYYEGSWKEATNNNDGTFFINTAKTSLSLRMAYEYGIQTKSNVPIGSDTIIFQTVNAQIQLQNSSGVLIDTGTVKYYAGAWRDLGTTVNGIASKELLPANYSFRMTYAYASKDKQQDLNTNPTVVFQTVNAAVQLQNSQGNLIDQGAVQYYSGAWRTFGTTTNGVANKELLPNNYSFRMIYAYASKDKQQDLNTNPTVVFQTVNAVVQLQNSQGSLIDQGAVQYYSGAWRSLGTTVNGIAGKELLPNNYSFRMTYEYASIDKQQDLSVNNVVSFSTVLCTIRVKNTQNEQIDGATASYYSGAWRQIGLTVNGEVTKELLPLNLSFRVKFGTQQQDKQQNLSTNNVVEFTVQ